MIATAATSTSATSATLAASNSSTEYELLSPPSDGITCIRINNRSLLASSWDANVRLYDIQTNELKTSYHHKAAVLDCCFSDRHHTYSGGLDKNIKFFDINTASEKVVGNHIKAVKCVEFSVYSNVLITGSWDATIKLWDPRNDQCLGNYPQTDKVFTMSHINEKLVVGTAGRQVAIYDLRKMEEPLQKKESSLKYQTRCIRCFPNGEGYALGSVEGRIAMEYFDPSPEMQAKKYAFKCHRVSRSGIDTVYPVNCIAFNGIYGTFASGGCDGIVNIWDGENKKRLFQFPKYPTSISSLSFSEDATLLAVASSYTFEEGEKDHPPDQIFVRHVSENEVKPKQKLQIA